MVKFWGWLAQEFWRKRGKVTIPGYGDNGKRLGLGIKRPLSMLSAVGG
jgi:hypothetical protein